MRSIKCKAVATNIVACVLISSTQAGAAPLVTYLTGDTPDAMALGAPDGQVVFRVEFDSAVKDSAKLTIAAIESTAGYRLDNIDIVPGSGFSKVIVTAQTSGDGALTSYDVTAGIALSELPDVVASTNASAPPVASSRPASIVPNAAFTHYIYTENQFGFAGATHRMMQVPITGGVPTVVYDGVDDGIVEFSGVEVIGDRLYFFAHDPAGAADERQLYSVELGVGGVAVGGSLAVEVTGLDRSSKFGGGSDGSDELDFDPSTGRLYGTNIGTGEVIGFVPGSGPIAKGALPFLVSEAAVTASAAVTVNDGLGLLSGIVTPGIGPMDGKQIDGIRPDGAGRLVVVGHRGVLASIDIAGVLLDGADDGDIIRLFNRDVAGAGFTIGFARADIGFDDHTILFVDPVPEPVTSLLVFLGALFLVPSLRRRASRRI